MNATMAPEQLLLCLNAAHEASALRHNISHEALILATVGSGSYVQAITAAMMTLGGAHAPLVETCLLLQAEDMIDRIKYAFPLIDETVSSTLTLDNETLLKMQNSTTKDRGQILSEVPCGEHQGVSQASHINERSALKNECEELRACICEEREDTQGAMSEMRTNRLSDPSPGLSQATSHRMAMSYLPPNSSSNQLKNTVPARYSRHGTRVPGWGNGFVKDGPDPLWAEVDQVLRDEANPYMVKVDAVTAVLHEAGKMIYPNPSCYTAVVALTLGLPPQASPYLFLAARLPKWTQEFVRLMGAAR